MQDAPGRTVGNGGRGMTIRGRLLLLAVAMLVPYALLVAAGAWQEWNEAGERALEAQQAEAERVAMQLENHVARMQELLAAIDAAVSDDLDAEARNDARLARLWSQVSGTVATLSLIKPDGRMVASATAGGAARAGVNVADRPHFRATMAARAFTIGEPVEARTARAWIIVMSRPILDADGGVRAVVAAGTPLGYLDALLDSMRVRAETVLSLASEKGIVVSRSPGAAEWRGKDMSGMPQFRVARSGGVFLGETTTEDGVRLYGASVPVRNAPWQVFAGIPVDRALAAARVSLLEHLLLAVVMLAVAAVTAWRLARGLVLPIRRLQRGVNALAQGQLGHRVEAGAGGEIGELAADINHMARRLEDAEARLRGLAAMSSDFFWETDVDFRITRLEGSADEVLGAAPESVLGRNPLELGLRVNGDVAAHRRMLDERRAFRDVEFVRLDAAHNVALVLLLSGEPRYGAGGEYLGYRGVARDATERNRLLAEVQRAQARLRLVVDTVPAMMAYVDREERFVFLNSGLAEFTGQSPKAAAGRPVREVLGEQAYAVIGPYMRRALAGERVEFERPFGDARGLRRDLRVQFVPDRDAAGAVAGVVVLTSDVSALMAAQRALAENEVRFRQVAELSSDWIWETDAGHRLTYLSGGLPRLLGIRAEEAIGRFPWEVGALDSPPGQRDAYRAAMEARQPFDDLRLAQRTALGRMLFQSVSARPLLDAAGGFAGYRGVGHDVTAQVEAEQALRAERDRLSRVLETMVEGLLILDAQGRYTAVNAAAERILGLRREALAGRHLLDVPWKRLPLGAGGNGLPENAFERLRGGERVVGPTAYLLQRADGLQRILSHQTARLEDADGAFAGVVATLEDITDRVRAEGRNRLFLQNALDGYWMTDMEGQILEVNRGMCEMLGYAEGELIGKTSFELAAGETPEEMRRRMLRVRERGNLRVEVQRRRRDGSVLYLDAAATYLPIEGGRVCAFFRDITDRRLADQRLAESEQRFRSLFELSQDGMAIHRDGVVEQANAAMARLLGAAGPEKLVGAHVADWVTPEHRDEVLERTARLLGGETQVPYRERKLQRLDGSHVDVEMGGGSFLEGGKLHLTVVVRDLSARKAHEREILELNADLERRVEARTAELTTAYREMEAFSYSVSHDLRAPLRAISGFSHIVLEDFRGEVPAEAQRLLVRVAQNAERMGTLIDGLLEFGRLSRQALRKQRIVVAELVREVLEEHAQAREGREIDLRVGDMPDCRADRVLLKQVYANLIANALKYTRQRAQAKIEIGSIVMGLGPVYYVRDNGAGFDMAYSNKLFGMFERLHSPSEFEGTGVGLALVRRIIERHGGKVWADSAVDKGATFFFRLGDEAPAAERSAGKAAA